MAVSIYSSNLRIEKIGPGDADGVSDSERIKQEEDLQQRLSEARKAAFEEEILRLNRETEQRAPELVKSLKAKDEALYREQLQDADEARKKEEKAVAELQRVTAERLDAERDRKKARRAEEARLRKDADAQRKQQEDEGRRKADDDRRKQEEILRQQREEFVRREQELRKQEEERRVLEEQLRVKEEEERKRRTAERKIREEQERIERENAERLRREEEVRQQTEELKRQEEERHRQEEEEKHNLEEKKKREEEEQKITEEQKRQNRIQQLIANAERFFDGGEYDLALVEVAKALVNDPENPVALDLDARIKEIHGKRPVQAPETKKKQPPRKRPRSRMRPISVDDQAPRPWLSHPALKWGGAGAVILAVVLVYLFRGSVFREPVRVAVLPFTSVSQTASEAALGSAIAEEVSHRLEQSDNATVLGFGSAVGLVRSEGWQPATLYRSGFPYAVEGSFTQSDLGYSADVRLKDSSGQVLWSKRFLKNPQSLVELPGDIAEEVSDRLNIDLPKLTTATTFNVEAYAAYLSGLSLAHHDDPESLRAACGKFQEAVERDQNLSIALAAYSTVLSRLTELGAGDSTTLRMGRDLADRAIQANSSFGPGYVASAYNHCLLHHYVQAIDQLDQAERYAPHLTSIPLVRAKVMLRSGRYADALKELGLAYDGSPRDPEVAELLGYAQTFNRIKGQAVGFHQLASRLVENPVRYISGPLADAMILDLDLSGTDRVIASLEERLQADPKDAEATYRLARMLQVSGKAQEGSAVLEQLEKQLREELKLTPGAAMPMAHLAKTLTRLGRFPEATAFARKAVESAPADPIVRYKIAQVFALQMYSPQKHKIDDKKKEEAIQALKAAVKLQYRADELANADFYNMYDQANFLGIIRDAAE